MKLFKKTKSEKVPQKKIESNNINIHKDLNATINIVRNELGNPSDLTFNYSVLPKSNTQCVSIYIETLIDKNAINSLSIEISDILTAEDKLTTHSSKDYFTAVFSFLSRFRKAQEGCELNILYQDLLSGKTIFLINGYDKFLSINTSSTAGRAIDEPSTQSVIRGPKEGFTEKIDVNIALVRKRIKSTSLRVEDLTVGSTTNTQITLMYVNTIARKDIIDEIKRRLNKIQIDGILDSGNIEELIKDDRYSIFPEFLNSEKPDSVAAALLEGRVAILVDGTAFVLTAPALFVEFLQASEDYYHHFMISTLIRIIRYIAFFLTIFVPSLYISLVTFHQEMIPTPLLISIAAQREGIPFPAFVEALLMEMIFEILREAGVRMPRVIGQAISIVGALVLGQAAVEAGIISAVMVIIVSITAISSFAIPNYSMANAARVIRFALMLLAGLFGLYGIFMSIIVLVVHLCKLKSIGVPYMTPIAPKTKYALKDTIIRYPIWKNRFRPAGISANNPQRISGDNPVTPKEKRKPEFR